jgi:hypothetical protein
MQKRSVIVVLLVLGCVLLALLILCVTAGRAIHSADTAAQRRIAILEARVSQLSDDVARLRSVKPPSLAPSPEQPQQPPIVEAEGFILRDTAGRIVLRLGFDRLGNVDRIPGLYLYDITGRKRLMVVNSGWGVGIGLHDFRGRAILEFVDQVVDRPGRPSGYTAGVLSPQKEAPDDWLIPE